VSSHKRDRGSHDDSGGSGADTLRVQGIEKTVIDFASVGTGHPLVIAVLVVTIWAVAYGLYGRGSDITKRTNDADPKTNIHDEVLGGSKRSSWY
jgi:hypothetical protein